MSAIARECSLLTRLRLLADSLEHYKLKVDIQKFVCAHPPSVAQHLKKQTRIILTYVFR